jgi:hypothetical protein
MLHQRFSALCIELGWLLAAHDLVIGWLGMSGLRVAGVCLLE